MENKENMCVFMKNKNIITVLLFSKPVLEDSKPKWPPTQPNGGPYMHLDISLKLRGPLIQQRVLFWDDIYDKYYIYPSPPSPQ